MLLDTLVEFLSTGYRIVGLVLAALGLAVALLAKRITKAIRKSDTVASDDKIYIGLLAFSLCLLLAGLLVSIL